MHLGQGRGSGIGGELLREALPIASLTSSDQSPAVPQTGGLLYILALVAPGLQGLPAVSVPLWQLHLPSPSGFSLDNLLFLSDYS